MKPEIITIPLPTPFPVGRINVYLVINDPITLIDTGLNSARSLNELDAGLKAKNLDRSDIERILITHFHGDHAGAAARLSNICGAELIISRTAASLISEDAKRDQLGWDFLARCGAGASHTEKLKKLFAAGARFGWLDEKPERITWLDTSGAIKFDDFELNIIPTPGHSPEHFCYHEPESGVLFCGDHLLAQVTPNPGIYFNPLDGYKRPKSLINYLDSLKRVEDLNPQTVLPGHGEPIGDLGALLAKYRGFIDERRRDLLKIIKQEGRLGVNDLVGKYFNNLDLINGMLAISEVVAYLDLLKSDGNVELDDSGDQIKIIPKDF